MIFLLKCLKNIKNLSKKLFDKSKNILNLFQFLIFMLINFKVKIFFFQKTYFFKKNY